MLVYPVARLDPFVCGLETGFAEKDIHPVGDNQYSSRYPGGGALRFCQVDAYAACEYYPAGHQEKKEAQHGEQQGIIQPCLKKLPVPKRQHPPCESACRTWDAGQILNQTKLDGAAVVKAQP